MRDSLGRAGGHPGRREKPATDEAFSQCPTLTVLLAYPTVGPWEILQGSCLPAGLTPSSLPLTTAVEYGALIQTRPALPVL